MMNFELETRAFCIDKLQKKYALVIDELKFVPILYVIFFSSFSSDGKQMFDNWIFQVVREHFSFFQNYDLASKLGLIHNLGVRKEFKKI